MNLEILKALNEERAARRAAIVVTDTATGTQRFVKGGDAASDPLREILQKALRTGKSGMEETPQGQVFLTVHVPPPRLVVIGAVHISQALAPMAAMLDYDVTINKWFNSLSPGNEQTFFWGSAAADQKGSRNYAGVKDPVVDALVAVLPNAATRDELVATTHALDRVLMQGHYMIPLYYLGVDDIAFWKPLRHPDTLSLYGNMLESWWKE